MYIHICSTEWIGSAITLNKQQTLLPYLNSDHIDCMLNKDKSINKIHDAWHASRARQPHKIQGVVDYIFTKNQFH